MKDKLVPIKFIRLFNIMVPAYFLICLICAIANFLDQNITVIYYDSVELVFCLVAFIYFFIKLLSSLNKVKIEVNITSFINWLGYLLFYISFSNLFLSKIAMKVMIFSPVYCPIIFCCFGVSSILLVLSAFPFSRKKINSNTTISSLFIFLSLLINIGYMILSLCIVCGTDKSLLEIGVQFFLNPFILVKMSTVLVLELIILFFIFYLNFIPSIANFYKNFRKNIVQA